MYHHATPDDIPVLAELIGRSFRMDPRRRIELWQEGKARTPISDGRLWVDGARGPVAGMMLFERGIAVAGQELAAGLLAAVGVPPEQRRRGYARQLLSAGLREMRERGLPLSLLYPYSIPFYNRLGYGVCGYVWSLEFPMAQLANFDELFETRRLVEGDLPAMQRLYERERARHSGWMARTAWEWRERVLDLPGNSPWPERTEGIVVLGEGDELRGYLTYTLADRDGHHLVSRERALAIQEWVSEEDGAWRALAGFVAAQRAQAKFVTYTAPPGFPLLHALAERGTARDPRPTEFAHRDSLSFGAGLMLRLVHFERALAERPYPHGVEGEIVVQQRDPQLPDNERPLHLYIGGGRAAVAPAAPGTTPHAVADARTWAELYSSALAPRDARLLQRLDADDATLALLAAAFAGEPWFLHRADWF